MTLIELTDFLQSLPEPVRQELDSELRRVTPVWVPNAGPQQAAMASPADVLFYGGAAGGGKTDLLLGLALTQHRKSIIFRREGTQLTGIIERATEILGSRQGFNGQGLGLWRYDGRLIEFGAAKDLGDETRYQGRAHDLKGFDEITTFLEKQFRYLMGWLRTENPEQRTRVVCTGNPPTTSDGDWVIQYWAPWLDPQHPKKAEQGELRWYAMLAGKEVAVPDSTPLEHKGETIHPKSRTFIASKVKDNPHYVRSGYASQLQAFPEPLRSQMLHGDFAVRYTDDPWQVIPTEWVRIAQARWSEEGGRGLIMDSMGVDVARGGRDETVLALRYAWWFAPLVTFPGSATPDGPTVAGHVVSRLRDNAPVHVDVIGVGGSVYDHLKGNNVHVMPINGANGTEERDRNKQLGFVNMRALLWWRMREALDPVTGQKLALPPDSSLAADLCAPRWELKARGIQVESKEDIIERLGRSPDKGDALVYALINTPKKAGPYAKTRRVDANTTYDPLRRR